MSTPEELVEALKCDTEPMSAGHGGTCICFPCCVKLLAEERERCARIVEESSIEDTEVYEVVRKIRLGL